MVVGARRTGLISWKTADLMRSSEQTVYKPLKHRAAKQSAALESEMSNQNYLTGLS